LRALPREGTTRADPSHDRSGPARLGADP
jgi:hypothetical protein